VRDRRGEGGPPNGILREYLKKGLDIVERNRGGIELILVGKGRGGSYMGGQKQ